MKLTATSKCPPPAIDMSAPLSSQAPDATIHAYRVFSCVSGFSSDDIIIAAMERVSGCLVESRASPPSGQQASRVWDIYVTTGTHAHL